MCQLSGIRIQFFRRNQWLEQRDKCRHVPAYNLPNPFGGEAEIHMRQP